MLVGVAVSRYVSLSREHYEGSYEQTAKFLLLHEIVYAVYVQQTCSHYC
jgi:hypothetical protein